MSLSFYDEKYRYLSLFSTSGALPDKELTWLKYLTGNELEVKNTSDLWMEYLTNEGYTNGSVHDRQIRWLTDLGYTQGTLQDRFYRFYIEDGGVRMALPKVIAYGSAAAHTGTTANTTLATITLPANSLGANGLLEIFYAVSVPNNANNKIMRIQFGGTVIHGVTLTASVGFNYEQLVQNVGATNVQWCQPQANSISFAATTVDIVSAAIDTTADVTILIQGQLGNSADSITLRRYFVRATKVG